jgi:peptide chain release factor 2
VDDKGLSDGFAELRRKLQDWNEREAIVAMRDERATCLAETNKPTFWDNGDKARATLARFYMLERLLKRLQQLTDRAEYLEELSTLVHRQRDPRYRAELADGYERLHRDLAFLEVELLCAHLTDNHRAVLRVRRIGPPQRDDGQGWAAQLVAMYLRWAARKGYELELYALEPLDENARRGDGLIAQYYPYRWRAIETSDVDAAIRQLLNMEESSEIAIGMGGTNVYGFMKGERGVHRRSDRRQSGERIQRMAEVQVTTTSGVDSDIWLEKLLLQRAWEEQDRAKLTARQREKLPQPSEPEVVRVYQVEGERLVRDLRTQIKTSNVAEVLEGTLDDFILAYLREEEAKQAWRE